MFRPALAAVSFLLLGAALLPAPPLHGQLTEGILAPAGRLRLEVSPEFDVWSRRFGATGDEPLGADLERAPLDIASLQGSLRAALADAALDLSLGSLRALVARDRTRVTFGSALGVTDWLTVGASLPLVRPRTEIAWDLRAGDLGLNPRLKGDGRVDGFLAGLAGSRAALAARAAQSCPAAPECGALTDLLDRVTVLATHLTAAYQGSPLFPTAPSAAGTALASRLAALREEIGQEAAGVPVPGTAPLADAALSQTDLTAILTDPAGEYQLVQPLTTTPNAWAMGDAELSVALRLIQGAVRDSTSGRDRFAYVVGAQGLVRLPTGRQDDPSIPLDLGTGDGQTDLEGGAFADLRWEKVGVRVEGRYGLQRPTDVVRRVAPPSVAFAPAASLATVEWTPGSYLALEAAPSWYLADEFAIGGTYRLWSKQADAYAFTGPRPAEDPSGYDASVLGEDTAEKSHEVGLGLAFSTLDGWREGRASIPFELRLTVRRAIGGSGRNTPRGTRMETTARVFWRLWGADPAGTSTP